MADQEKEASVPKIEIEVNYNNHSIQKVSGLPVGTELTLREYADYGDLLSVYVSDTDGKPVFVRQDQECYRCGGAKMEPDDVGGGPCCACEGRGVNPDD